MSDSLQQIYDRYIFLTEEILSENIDVSPLEIAAAMLTQALTIYKTVLNDEDFYRMMDSIYESKDKVRKIEPTTIQ